MRMLLAGNWKMHGLRSALAEIRAIGRSLVDQPAPCDVLICPPATLISEAAKTAEGGPVAVGAQDCHAEAYGAFTGDISAEMLRDAGATTVILGHSERRQYYGETDADVATKLGAARRAGLSAIVCVGESEAQRDSGQTLAVVLSQLSACLLPDGATVGLAIAYEPIWAIGSGKTPTAKQIVEVHEAVRSALESRFGEAGRNVRILYGGSLKPANAAEILALPAVNGALVGGASLKAGDFLAIIRAAPKR